MVIAILLIAHYHTGQGFYASGNNLWTVFGHAVKINLMWIMPQQSPCAISDCPGHTRRSPGIAELLQEFFRVPDSVVSFVW
jgi:hypothetical protein